MLKKKYLLGLIVLALPLLMAACSTGNATASSQKIKAAWITPQVVGEIVSIPVNTIQDKTHIHFKVASPTGDIAFMAYTLNGEITVRSNICPPCRSIGFSLSGDTLVCDTCGTVFNAVTGDGISGACIAYSKAEVAYTTDQGNITLAMSDLVDAYQKTKVAGWP